MSKNAKQIILDTARSMGFHHAVVAGLDPLEAESHFYKDWLARGFASTMEYLKRDPEKRMSPALLCPEAVSAVMLYASYYTEGPEDPGPEYGRVARYAVGLDYHDVLPQKIALLKASVEEKLGRPLLGKYFTDNVELFEQALAARHGLGFTGKNSLLIGPAMSGSYHFVAEFFTDLPLEPDLRYEGTCGKCFRCGISCPSSAIVEEKTVDSNLCISFLTIENKGGIELSLRKCLGHWVFGCDVCQEVCPYNQRPPKTDWVEFQPESGAGHYLNLLEVLRIKDKPEFMAKFGKTALSRAKRRGLVRNALVVIGNRLPEAGASELVEFIEGEQDSMLVEHAAWALSQYDSGSGKLKELHTRIASSLRTCLDPHI